MPANRALGCICCTALSFFAVGARLAGEPGAAVYLLHRVIVLRCRSQACRRTGRRGVSIAPRYRFSRASLAPTGEPGAAVYLSHRVIVFRGQASLLQANRALGCICRTALSFFAGKPRSYRRTGRWGASVAPRYRFSRASLAPTGEPGAGVHLSHRVIVFRGHARSLHRSLQWSRQTHREPQLTHLLPPGI
ncbi:hypothetical protein PS874_01732 [Pseudomonas fluorescens]|nr:hypothetical protein PS874_01732 [Pseudomonas fluorescens]